MTPDDMHIRGMTRDELDVLVEWAAREGWNPGLDDAEVFWNTDPDGFVVAEIDGELVGGGSIVAYDKRYGFMGFFIMRPDCRGRGLGDRLWNERKRRLLGRLNADASIGMDGVFNMQAVLCARRVPLRLPRPPFRRTRRGVSAARGHRRSELSSVRAHRRLRSSTFSGAARPGSCEAGFNALEAMLSLWCKTMRYAVMGSCGLVGLDTRSALFSLRTAVWRSSS